MDTFESSIKTVPFPQERVYAKLADLNNLEGVKDKIPAEKIKELSFDTDHITFKMDPVGSITLRIVDREPCKTIKFEADKSPVASNLWVQIVPLNENECKIKLTIKAELNVFIRGMVKGYIQKGLEKIAEVLAVLPY